MVTSLSSEILQIIIQHATSVPSAFDTSVEGSVSNKENEVSLAINESMRSRLALCRVSKLFYAVALEKLYEIVTIRSFNDVFRLKTLLRLRTKVGGNLRGWYCRRLELRFAQGRQVYRGHHWDSGAKNLWGLADACPNLIVFIANITRNEVHYRGPSHFTIPRMLFQTIAHTCAKTLRRFEMHGDTRVGFDRVEMFLRYCPVIEVFRLNAVDPHGSMGQKFLYDNIDNIWEEHWSDDEPIDEFRESVKVIRWPQLIDAPESLEDAPLVLPHLHTLEIMHGSVIRANWSLPSLRTLGLKFYSDYERRGDPLSFVTEHLANVLPLAQITRLSYSGTSPFLWGIINAFPNLTELGFGSGDLDFLPRRPELNLHADLAHIKFCPASPDAFTDFLDRITDAIKSGLMPTLKTLEVYGPINDTHKRMSTYRLNVLNELGVKTEIRGDQGSWLLRVKYTKRTREDAYFEM